MDDRRLGAGPRGHQAAAAPAARRSWSGGPGSTPSSTPASTAASRSSWSAPRPARASRRCSRRGWPTRSEPVAWLQVEERDSDPARFWSYLVQADRAQPPRCRRPSSNRWSPARNGDDGRGRPGPGQRARRRRAGPLLRGGRRLPPHRRRSGAPGGRAARRPLPAAGHARARHPLRPAVPPRPVAGARAGCGGPRRRPPVRHRGGRRAARRDGAGRSTRTLLDQLCGRTEGWAAGLVLAGLSLERRSGDPDGFVAAFRGDDQLVVEYLRDELLAGRRRRRPPPAAGDVGPRPADRRRWSTPSPARPDGAEWLRETAGANQLLVAPRPHRRPGSATTTCCATCSFSRPAATMPERLPELHGRAAAWFETAGDHGRAVDHRLAAGDLDEAAAADARPRPRLLRSGQVETLRGLLDRIGERGSHATWRARSWPAGASTSPAATPRPSAWLDVARRVAPAGFDPMSRRRCASTSPSASGDVGRRARRGEGRRRPTGRLEASLPSWPPRSAPPTPGPGSPTRRATALGDRRRRGPMWRTAVRPHTCSPSCTWRSSSSSTARPPRAQAAATAIDDRRAVRAGRVPRRRPRPSPSAARDQRRPGTGPRRHRSTRWRSPAGRRPPLALGYVLTVCGDTLLDLGDPAGVALLAEARSVARPVPRPRHRRSLPRPGRVTPRLHRPGAAPVAALVEQLTDRELAVLRYLPDAMSQRDIAAELYVSLNTVQDPLPRHLPQARRRRSPCSRPSRP